MAADRPGSRLTHAVALVRNPHTGAIRGPVWLSLASVVNGAGTYLLLIIVARVLGAHLYADFAVFWSFLVICGFGVFLPLEQELARRTARAGRDGTADSAGPAVLRRGLSLGAGLAVGVLVVGAVGWATAFRSIPFDPLLVVSVVLMAAGQAVQFACRGRLSGRLQLRDYALVLATDTLVRLVAAAVAAAAGVRSVGVYALVISVSAVAAAAVAWWFATRPAPGPAADHPAAPADPESLLHKVGGLIVGAAAMQLLLNGGPLIARGLAAPDELVLAGTLLATMTLARVPVFLQQSMQASYLARLAGQAHRGERRALHRTLTLLMGAGAALGLLTVLVSAAVGPWLIALIYGPTFQISRVGAVLVAAGVAAYLLGGIANDCTIALGRHRAVATAWLAAAVVGAVLVLLSADLLLKSTLPLIGGGLVAGGVLVTTVWRSAARIGTGNPSTLPRNGIDGAT